MENEVKTETADSVENTASTTVNEPSNISQEDFIEKRLGGEAKTEGNSQVKPEEKKEAKRPEKPDVLSQVTDLDNLSDSDLKDLSEKLGSRAVARFGELTAKRKAAEEKAAKLEQQLSTRTRVKYSDEDIQSNPYKDIKDPNALQAKSKELSDVIEWAEEVLFDSDDYSANDVVTSVEGKDYTKKDVRNALKNARKSKTKHLPMQFNAIREEAQGVQMRQGYARRAIEELPWMKDQNNNVSKKYNAMIRDPRLVKSFKSASPEMKAQLPYLLAHAANSLYGRKVLPTNSEPAKQTVPLSPPKAGSTAAKPARPSAKKKAKAYHSQFKNTGDSSDFIKLRTLQLENR
jgi:hypothetical protein